MSTSQFFVPDIQIEQYENRVIISGPDVGPLKLTLRAVGDLHLNVTRYAQQMEKARP